MPLIACQSCGHLKPIGVPCPICNRVGHPERFSDLQSGGRIVTHPPDAENFRRVESIAAVQKLDHFPHTDPEEFVTDLIANAMHFCQAKGVDFSAALDRAESHFREERTNS